MSLPQMNLEDPPRCIMIKLFPGAAKRVAHRVRLLFKIDNSRFLNVEGKSESLITTLS